MNGRIPFRMTEPNHSIYLFCLHPLQRQNPGVRKKINEWILLQSVQNIWELICLYLTEKRCGKWQLFSACYLQWCTNWVTFSRGQNKKPLWTSYRTFNYTRTPKLCRYTVICLTTGTRFPGFYWDRFCSRVAGCTRPQLSPAWQPDQFGSSLSRMISATTKSERLRIQLEWHGPEKESKIVNVINLQCFHTFPNLLLFLHEIWSFWPLGGLSKAHAKASSHSGVAPVDTICVWSHAS